MSKRQRKPAPAEPADTSTAVTQRTSAGLDTCLIPIDQIHIDGNHRLVTDPAVEQAAIDARAASMAAVGQQVPIRVRQLRATDAGPLQKNFIAVDGRRRIAAALKLGWAHIRAEVGQPASAEVIEQEAAIANLERDDLTVLDEGLLVARMLALRPSFESVTDQHAAVAAHLGRSPSWVRDRAYMARICPEVQQLAAAGLFLAGHLIELAKIGDANEQVQAAAKSLHGGNWYTVRNEKDRQRAIKEFIDEAANGGRPRLPTVERVAQCVQETQRSLRMVPWRMDTPFAGMPACDGCPHNSRSDVTLFGQSAEDDRGSCLGGGCFDAKTKAAERAKADAARKLVKQKTASVAAAAEVAPTWLKPESAARLAKKELDAKAAGKGGNAGKAKGEKSEPHAELKNAIRTFDSALDKWSDDAWKKMAGAKFGMNVVACMLLLKYCKGFKAEHYRVDTYWYGPKAPTKPGRIPRISDRTAQLIASAAKGDLAAIVAEMDPKNRQIARELFYLKPYDATLQLAEALGVKIDRYPEWPAFDPANTKNQAGKPGDGRGDPAGDKDKKSPGRAPKGKRSKKAAAAVEDVDQDDEEADQQ